MRKKPRGLSIRGAALDVVIAGALVGSAALLTIRVMNRARLADPQALEVLAVEPGDLLKDIPLSARGADGSSLSTSLRELVGDGPTECSLLIFFSPICRICRNIAHEWAGFERVSVKAEDMMVRWISLHPSLPENEPFMDRHFLPWPWYAIGSVGDGVSIGVDRWPLMYVVHKDGRYLATGPQVPWQFTVNQACKGPDAQETTTADRGAE